MNKLYNTNVWEDIQTHFRELFEQYPDHDHFISTPEDLKLDLGNKFDGQYDPDEILQLLTNGYKQEHADVFVFKRISFILPVVKKGEEDA